MIQQYATPAGPWLRPIPCVTHLVHSHMFCWLKACDAQRTKPVEPGTVHEALNWHVENVDCEKCLEVAGGGRR